MKANSSNDDFVDIFGREAIAERMCELICSSAAKVISPIVLDGPWGCGKTTHARRIERIIEEKKAETHKCIYWNAACSDFADDPLPMFVAAMYKHVPSRKKQMFSGAALKLCGAAIAGGSVNTGLQLIKFGGVDVSKVVEAGKKSIDKVRTSELKKDKFRQFLKEASDTEMRMHNAHVLIETISKDKEVIFIIDELDRCRPDFALRMLENIKHLFDLPNCKFIIIANKETLISSVGRLYGLRASLSDLYINKCVKFCMQLPMIVPGSTNNCNVVYFSYLTRDLHDWKISGNKMLCYMIETLSECRIIHLREIERASSLVHLIAKEETVRNTCMKNDFFSMLVATMALVIVNNNHLIASIYSKSTSAQKVIRELGLAMPIDSHMYFPDDHMHGIVVEYFIDIFEIYLPKYEYFSNVVLEKRSDKPRWKNSNIMSGSIVLLKTCLEYGLMLH